MITKSKRSRYYHLEEVTFPDRHGIERQSKALRRAPVVAGQFLHTLDANDRLDHLAFKYYRQSLHWWRICDANPQFTDPLAMVGKTPVSTIWLELTWNNGAPPLTGLYSALAGVTGVMRVIKDADNGLPELEITDGAPLFTLPGALQAALDSAVLSQSLPPALNAALLAAGLVLPASLRISKPENNLWHIENTANAALYRFRPGGALLAVNRGVWNYLIGLSVVYNRDSVTQQTIVSRIEALGFTAETVEPITRIGQGIVIPPRYTGRD